MGFGIGNFFSRIFSPSSTAEVTPTEQPKTTETPAKKPQPEIKHSFETFEAKPSTQETSVASQETEIAGNQESFSPLGLQIQQSGAGAVITAEEYNPELTAFSHYIGRSEKVALEELEYTKEWGDASKVETAVAEYHEISASYFAESDYSQEDAEALSQLWNLSTKDAVGFAVKLMQDGKGDSLEQALEAAR